MPRYIEADRFFEDFPEIRDYEFISQEYDADVVEVVRCKDCKHYWKNCKNAEPENEDDLGICLASPKDDAFCSEGERKDDAEIH